MTPLGKLLHYDMMADSQPEWRISIEMLLLGQPGLFETLVTRMRAVMPVAANFLIAGARYRTEGSQVFAIGPEFRELLHETGADSIPRELIRLPYPCVYVAFPDCPWRLWGGPDTGMHILSGAYLFENGGTDLGVLLWGRANSKSIDPGDDASFSMVLRLGDHVAREDDPSCYDIESYVTEIMGDARREDSDKGMSLTDAPAEARDEQNSSVLSAVRVLLNLILYLNSDNAEREREGGNLPSLRKALTRTKNPKKRRKLQKRIDRAATRITFVGRSFERSDSTPGTRTATGGSTWAYRRGHFSFFWVGPRKDGEGQAQKGTHRVLKWVSPVRRDPSSILASQTRIHIVKGEGK